MTLTTSTGIIRTELLSVAETVAREKGIQRDEVLEAMEMAIQKAARAKYGHERDIRAEIDRKNGEITVFACREVVEEVDNDTIQISFKDAQKIEPTSELGSFIKTYLPPIDFDRVAEQNAKQVILDRKSTRMNSSP